MNNDLDAFFSLALIQAFHRENGNGTGFMKIRSGGYKKGDEVINGRGSIKFSFVGQTLLARSMQRVLTERN